TFDGVYQGVRIKGSADTTGTITDFAPHPDQNGLLPPTHLEPPPPRGLYDDPAFGDVALRFLTYGSTSDRTGVHYTLPGPDGALAQRKHGVLINPTWAAHPNGTQWATVWFREPNLRGLTAQAAAGNAPPPLEWQRGDQEIGAVLGADGTVNTGQLLFPDRWSVSDLRNAIAGAHRNALGNSSWTAAPEGGYLWEGVHDGVRMHGHVRDGEHLWARPSSDQPLLPPTSSEVIAVTAPLGFSVPKPGGQVAVFSVQRVIHQDGTLGMRVTRVLPHPSLAQEQHSRLVDQQMPEVRQQLAAEFKWRDPLQRRELSEGTFDVELSPTDDPTVKLSRRSELFQIMMDNVDTSTLADLTLVHPTDQQGLDSFLYNVAALLPPVPPTPAGWQGPQGQQHHTLGSVWASDVTTSVHRNTPAGLLDEPGVRELLAQHRSQNPPPGPLTNANTNTHTGGNESTGTDTGTDTGTGTGTGTGTERTATAAEALGLHPSDLTSIDVVLQGTAPLRPALDALDQLAARLEAGPTGPFVRRMTEIGSPLSEWWSFSSYLHTKQSLLSSVVGMDLAGAKKLLNDSRTHPLPLMPHDTAAQAHALGVHPRYLTRLADTLKVRPEDVTNLGEDKSFWQQPLSPETLGQNYRDREREKREDIRIARDHTRFDAAADELLGSDPARTEQRFRSFMHWAPDAQHLGLDVFTDQRLRELVEHWRKETQDGTKPVPADFNPREKGRHQADLFLTVELAERSGPLPPKLAGELAYYKEFVQFQLMQLDVRYKGGVAQDDGPPATPSTDPHPAQSASTQPHASPNAPRQTQHAGPHRAPASPPTLTPTADYSVAEIPTAPFPPAPRPEPVTDVRSLGTADVVRPSNRTRELGGAAAPVHERAFSVERTLLSDGSVRSDVTVRIHLDLQPGATTNHVANAKAMAKRGVDTYYNAPNHRLPNGDLLRVELEFVDDPAQAHRKVELHPDPDGEGRDDSATWYVAEDGAGGEDKSHVIAHETGHLLGFQDQYREATEGEPLRPVHDD
ncbi:hypothetical protein ACFU8Q_40625, partial [Streptomyces sp. NPDC057543]